MLQSNQFAPMGTMMYNPQGVQNQPKVMNVLTAEEINQLKAQTSEFSLALTQKEALQGACNHRLPDGSGDSLVYDDITGKVRCTICGYEFRPVQDDSSPEEITDAVERIVDILQTIKLLYTDLPATPAREYFQIIPLLYKVPELFKFAAKNFAKHEFNGWQYNNQNMGGMAMLQNLGMMLGASQGMPQMQAQPNMMGGMNPAYGMMGAGMPQMAAQPVAPGSVAPGMNPFGFAGASQPQTQQPNPGYAYTPGQVAQPVQPTVAAPTAPAAPAADAQPTETVAAQVTV